MSTVGEWLAHLGTQGNTLTVYRVTELLEILDGLDQAPCSTLAGRIRVELRKMGLREEWRRPS